MSSLIVEVCKVKEVKKHPNADGLSIIKVKGWSCITMLDQYEVGDLVIFIPPDSIIPESMIEKYKLSYLKKNGRVRTVKLRGELSEGLVLSLPDDSLKEGDNVAEKLGITKWEPQESHKTFRKQGMRISKKKLNPLFDKYTDIENIKNYMELFEPGEMVHISEKIHGANWRGGYLPIIIDKKQPLWYQIKKLFEKYILKRNYEFVYGSRNVQLHDGNKDSNYYGDDIWGKVAKKYDFMNIKEKDCIFYGEVYGKGIQDLSYGINGIDLVIFDIKRNGEYVPLKEVEQICAKYGLPMVPSLYYGEWNNNLIDTYSHGNSVLDPSQIREGCVIKTVTEKTDWRFGRKILKAINTDYLTRKGGTEFK